MIILQDNPEPLTQVPLLPWDPLPLPPSSSPQARPEHLRSARGLSMEPGPLYRLTHQVFLRSKARDVPQEGFTFPRQHSQHWRTKSPTIKGTPPMKYLVSLKNPQQKDLPLTNRKEVWCYWVRTCDSLDQEPVEGSRRFRLSSAQQASSSWLSVSLRTASLKTHKRYFPRLLQKHKVRLHSRPPIQFTLTCLSRKIWPQDSPDDQVWV